ncbi:MAG: hypothetical protein M0P57_08090 [Syntrophales bacterium]|jgi:hypothetical protein|nr:hypothetical protein [Syntrophales bacterium]MDY0045605.1 hypothetical protein [Syntrophales bacterium]
MKLIAEISQSGVDRVSIQSTTDREERLGEVLLHLIRPHLKNINADLKVFGEHLYDLKKK